MIFRRFLIIITFLFFRNKFSAYSCPFCSKAIPFCSQLFPFCFSGRNPLSVGPFRLHQEKTALAIMPKPFSCIHYSSVINSAISGSASSMGSSEEMASSPESTSPEASSLKLISSSSEISRISSVLKCVER